MANLFWQEEDGSLWNKKKMEPGNRFVPRGT